MILAVHRSGVGVHPNRLVMLAYLDLTVRYATVLHCNAELLLPVLRGMLGAGYVPAVLSVLHLVGVGACLAVPWTHHPCRAAPRCLVQQGLEARG